MHQPPMSSICNKHILNLKWSDESLLTTVLFLQQDNVIATPPQKFLQNLSPLSPNPFSNRCVQVTWSGVM